MVNKKWDKTKYEEYKNEFIKQSNEKGLPLGVAELENNFKIPYGHWMIVNCPDKNVNNYSNFIEYCGFKPTYHISKEYATEAIFKKIKKINRKLMFDDFRNPNIKEGEIGISTIKNHWGSFNKMLIDLGFEINQEDMVAKHKSITIREICEELNEKCIILTENGKYPVNQRELNKILKYNINTYYKYIKNYFDDTISEYLSSYGFEVIQEGRGLNYIFSDGEKILSQYELSFTKFLRKIRLRCFYDYLRDVKYNTFIKGYEGNLNIDYIINYEDRVIYIEIAGLLKDYKKNYINDMPIKSKSKEDYRLKLKEKEKMLKENNLEYYILFPEDLNTNTVHKIFDINCTSLIDYLFDSKFDN